MMLTLRSQECRCDNERSLRDNVCPQSVAVLDGNDSDLGPLERHLSPLEHYLPRNVSQELQPATNDDQKGEQGLVPPNLINVTPKHKSKDCGEDNCSRYRGGVIEESMWSVA